jgi:sialic acid synthase SpsE
MADILKFQLGHSRNDPIRYIDHLAPKLKYWCADHDVEFMASIWNFDALELARSLDMKRYKIAHQLALSEDEDDKKLVQEIFSDNKETFVSGRNRWYKPHIKGIYCSPKYPTYPENLDMPTNFSEGYWYGYSDHTHGIAAPLMAIARGAKYIEVHVTLNKAQPEIRDNMFACTPDEFETLVRLGKQIARLA